MFFLFFVFSVFFSSLFTWQDIALNMLYLFQLNTIQISLPLFLSAQESKIVCCRKEHVNRFGCSHYFTSFGCVCRSFIVEVYIRFPFFDKKRQRKVFRFPFLLSLFIPFRFSNAGTLHFCNHHVSFFFILSSLVDNHAG